MDAHRPDVHDLRLPVCGVGDDPRLGAGQRDRLVAEVVDGHRRQCAGDALTDGDEHVQLARVGPRRDRAGERDQVVRRVAHRGQHRHDAAARLPGGHDPSANRLQLLDVGDGAATELHHDRAQMQRRLAGNRGNGLVLGRGHCLDCRRRQRRSCRLDRCVRRDVRVHEPFTVSDAHGLRAAVHVELREDPLDMGGDRLRADEELCGDRFLCLPLGEQTQDLALPVGQTT